MTQQESFRWPETLIVVRHAESYGNVIQAPLWRFLHLLQYMPFPKTLARRDYDWKLTRRGRWQAERTGAWLQKAFGDFDAAYASERRRAVETLRIVSPERFIVCDARLNELPFEVYRTTSAPALEAILAPRITEARTLLDDIRRLHAGQRVLIVGHRAHANLLHSVISDFPFEETVRETVEGEYLRNAAVSVYRRDGNRLLRVQHNIIPWLENGA